MNPNSGDGSRRHGRSDGDGARSERDLVGTVAWLARRLPAEHVHAWAGVLDACPAPEAGLGARLIDAAPGYAVGPLASALTSAWQAAEPRPTGPALALALRSATAVHAIERQRRADVVVSGPRTDAVPVRLTSAVAVQLIREAHSTLLVVSFAAYGVAEVVSELRRAADRGVRIDLVMETAAPHGGGLRGTIDAGAAFDSIRDRARLWHWPAHNRANPRAALHAKLILADDTTVLLGSANLTDRALADNLEIGVILHDSDVSGTISRHFTALMHPDHGPLKPADWP